MWSLMRNGGRAIALAQAGDIARSAMSLLAHRRRSAASIRAQLVGAAQMAGHIRAHLNA